MPIYFFSMGGDSESIFSFFSFFVFFQIGPDFYLGVFWTRRLSRCRADKLLSGAQEGNSGQAGGAASQGF